MLEFILKNPTLKSTQATINRQNPKVNIIVGDDLPIPSLQTIKRMAPIVAKINALESQISQLSDDQLRAKTKEFRDQYPQSVQKEKQDIIRIKEEVNNAKTQQEREDLIIKLDQAKKNYKEAKRRYLDSILPEAFAMVREAGKRVLNMRHFDVQLIGGMVLNSGSIAEMRTGEGKTLVGTLPAYLNALTGEGVHIVTVNDYLARRDREWMGPLFEFLGLSVGVIQHDMPPPVRRQMYNCDITYGTNNEFGFDYLRDNMVIYKEDMVQREHHFAIVDEVDSILVDEARTPLIISGPAEESTDKYYRANEIAKQLKGRRVTESEEIDAKRRQEDLSKGFDYLAEEKGKSISLSEEGEDKAAKMFGVANLHDMETIEYRHHILQALRAKEFFRVDVDYVARDGEVIIVDEFTGRLMPGRRWSDGLHQAVEAKEGIKIERENQTLATITLQNYFRMFEKLSGMTGTAYTEANEFKQIYNVDTIVIPTNKKLQRINHADVIFRTLKEKYEAVVQEIEECHKLGRPVLVGTISIEKSELLSRLLKQKGITHQVLNAKYHELEANIVAQAGRFKAVTIATNMAGRGTDIMLGGNAEYLAKSLVDQKAKDIKEGEINKEDMIKKFLDQFRQQVKEEHEKVITAGGLHVIGTERHESRRIDNQLRGRQGRQGDPGSSRFYVSLEDDLMRLFAGNLGLVNKLWTEEGMALEHPLLNRAIETAQKRVENHNFEIRKHLLEYDNVMNKQREVIYGLRRSILESQDVKHMILDSLNEILHHVIDQHFQVEEQGVAADIENFKIALKSKFDYTLSAEAEQLKAMSKEEKVEFLYNDLVKVYEAKEQQVGSGILRQLERMVLLNTIDSKWKDHLYAMDQLKEGIGLRSFGQRDPLIEYKREAFSMFQVMYATINNEVAELVFKIQPVANAAPVRSKGVFSSLPQKLVHDEVSSLSQSNASQMTTPQRAMPQASAQAPTPSPVHSSGPKVGRNDPCPCGSGKKYKKCHGQ